jgi:type I restriction enzyme, S subunit
VSGCSPFGTLPSEWRSVPAKHATSLNPEALPESTPPDAELLYVDIAALEGGEVSNMLTPKQLTFEAAPSRARRVLRTGDTILSTVRTYLKAVANFPSAEESLIASTGFAVLRPNGTLHPRFAYWAVLSEPFIESVVSHSEGVSYPAINPAVLGALHLPVPPSAIQVQIANFLDEQTARIDALIAEKERLSGLTSEYRDSLILQTLCPKLISSEESQVRVARISFPKLSQMAWIGMGFPFPAALFGNSGTPVVRMSDFKEKLLALEDVKRVDPAFVPAESLANPGDILVGLSGSVGEVALVRDQDAPCAVNQRIAIIRATPRVVPRYLYWLLCSRYFVKELTRDIPETTIKNISSDELRGCRLPLPDLQRQSEIALILDEEVGALDGLKAHIAEHIDRLREYRSSLISAAVTGQLDINTFTSNLPEA